MSVRVCFTDVSLSVFFSEFRVFFGMFSGFHAKSSTRRQNLEKVKLVLFLYNLICHIFYINLCEKVLGI